MEKSDSCEGLLESLDELEESLSLKITKSDKSKNGAISKRHVRYPCWICSNNDPENGALRCEGCKPWTHVDCINVPGEVVDGINKGKRIRFDVHCDSCRSDG